MRLARKTKMVLRSPDENVAPPLVGGAPSQSAETRQSAFKTWGKSRSIRLEEFDYSEHAPYHVVLCAREGTRPFADAARASMVCDRLVAVIAECKGYLGAYCLMPDHLHVLLSPDRSGIELGDLIGRFKGITTNASWKLGWSGPLWQPRFYDHIVRKSEGIAKVAQYIYENSDRGELPIDYPFRFVDPQCV